MPAGVSNDRSGCVMPVVDAEAVERRRGVYDAVVEAIEAELSGYRANRVEPPSVWARWWERMRDRLPVAVPAYLVPAWGRPRLEAGRWPLVAEVSPDDRVTFRVETVAETIARLDL